MTSTAALQTALAAEHAACYAYGIVGAHLTDPQATQATADWIAHQQSRDQLIALLTAARTKPTPAAPAYQLPLQITTQATAISLAILLEQQVTAAYLPLAGTPSPALRQLAASNMQDCAIRVTRWNGTTTAFPGLPKTALLPPSP